MSYGGLLKSASALALVAAAGFYGASPAKAADLGGDCCADLEERVAELESTTARKGNRKVSLAISGFVSHQIVYWDDGSQSDMYIGDGGNLGSRWRFTGTAKISPNVTAGFLYEFQNNANGIQGFNQLNGGDDLGATGTSGVGTTAQPTGATVLRDSTVWLRHNQLGMVKIGHGSTATDNLTLIDLGNRGGAATSDIALYNGGFLLRSNAGVFAGTTATWAAAIRGHESFDTTRRNHVLYETPTLAGFTVQGAVAEDNYWDVALRYAGELSGFRIAGGIGYSEDTEFNAGSLLFSAAGPLCATNCNVKSTDLKGSLSILHVQTGLFVTGAGGRREIEDASTSANDLRWWHLTGGVNKNFFGVGNTVVFGEYTKSEGGLEQVAFLGGAAAAAQVSEVTQWGLGVTQHIDAAAMEIFATYKNYSLDVPGLTGSNAPADFQTVVVGTRINF